MNIFDLINSLVLVVLTIAFFMQNNKLKIIKTITDSYQPEKLKQAQEYIDKGNEHKINLLVSNKVNEICKISADRFMEANKTFHAQYDELISIYLSILKGKNWEEREKLLECLPKNAEQLRLLLEAFDSGDFEKFEAKQN